MKTEHPILFIHGANASSTSFNYLKERIGRSNVFMFEWDINADSLDQISFQLDEYVAKLDVENLHLVGHSMGGILAANAALSFPKNTRSLTTISSPFGGVDLPFALRLMHQYSMFVKNIHPDHPTIRRARLYKPSCPVLCVSSMGGNNKLLGEANDGAVTVRSQVYNSATEAMVTNLNHYEVLLDDHVANIVKFFIGEQES